MGMAEFTTRQCVMTERPVGNPTVDQFTVTEGSVPEPSDGEVLIRTLYLRIDPGTRARMQPPEAVPHLDPIGVGEPISGGAIGEVIVSNHPAFDPGDIVEGTVAWAEVDVIPGDGLRTVEFTSAPPRAVLGALGHSGRTAYFGLLDVGAPEAGETVVTSAAAGSVGSVAAQIAAIEGCRSVGICGSAEKVDYLEEELGLDAGIDYSAVEDLRAALAEACPEGVDVYFDCVAGEISDTVVRQMNERGRIVQCGRIATINEDEPTGPRDEGLFISKRLRKEGFVVYDYADRYDEAEANLERWFERGELTYRETISEGLETAPEVFVGLFEGKNIGKQLVRVDAPIDE